MVNRTTAEHFSFPPSLTRQTLLLVAAATVAVGGVTTYTLWRHQASPSNVAAIASASTPQITTVTALGRLEPRGEVIKISPPGSAEGNRIDQLRVQEGDWVKAGEVIAVLDSYNRLQAALEQAQEQVKLANANLARVTAGAKLGEIQAQEATIARLETEYHTEIAAQKAVLARIEVERQTAIEAQKAVLARIEAQQRGEIEAQQATISRLEAELQNAQVEDQRYQQLAQDGAISASLQDSKRLTLATTQQRLQEAKANLSRIRATQQQQINEATATLNQIQSSHQQKILEAQANLAGIQQGKPQQINEAKATLDRISEVRPVDVEAAAAEVSSAEAAVRQAQANLDLAAIRAPREGQILKIHTYPGEKVGTDGIVELGQTRQMDAVAEVYESDVHLVKVGQRAVVTSESFPGELQGTVEKIGLQVLRQNIVNTDPSANIDNRIVEVRVQLDAASSQKVAGLTNLQVKVVISQ